MSVPSRLLMFAFKKKKMMMLHRFGTWCFETRPCGGWKPTILKVSETRECLTRLQGENLSVVGCTQSDNMHFVQLLSY